MCEPTYAMAGLKAVSTVASINAQNEASMKNAMRARQAANNQYVQNAEKYIQDNRSILQAGFDRALEGREAESMAYASAIENGVQGKSVRAMLRDKNFQTTRNRMRTQQELESLESSAEARMINIHDRAEGRVASVPSTSFGLGDAAQILTPIVKKEMG